MDDQLLFEQFHREFDVEPRPGSFDRLRSAMAVARYRPSRREWLRLRLGRNGLRMIAVVVAIALALAGAGAFIAINHYVHRTVPVQVPHAAASGTCTRGLHMASDTRGWNGIYQHTSDGGQTWTQSNGPSVPNQTKGGGGGCTLDGLIGWALVAVGTGPTRADHLVVMITADGGQTWKQGGAVPSGSSIGAQGTLEFINAKDGWLLVDAGNGVTSNDPKAGAITEARTRTLFTTSDGGYHWVQLVSSGSILDHTAIGCAESGMTFVSGTRGWLTWNCNEGYSQPMSGGGPVVVVTDDGGSTWAPVKLAAQPLTSAYMCSAAAPLFVGPAGVMPMFCGGVGAPGWNGVYRTEDLGQTWIPAETPFWFQLQNIQFVNPNLGFAFASATTDPKTSLYRTTDAGQHWAVIKKDPFSGQRVGDFDFISQTTGFASTSTSQGAYWKTTDGGLTWTLPGHRVVPGNVGCPAPPIPNGAAPIPVLMATTTTGWAEGGRRTVDGGRHWTAAGTPSLPLQSSGEAEFYLDANHAWVAETAGSATTCADHIVVFSTTDGGRTWRQAAPISVVVPSPAGTIWHGSESSSPTVPFTGRGPWLDFVDPLDGWLLVDVPPAGFTGPSTYGPLFRTTDGGLHWSVASQQPSTDQSCDPSPGVVFSSPTTGWRPESNCGPDSTDLRLSVTHDGGATWLDQTLVKGCACQGAAPVFLDQKHGYLFGIGVFLLVTTSDGGATWKSYPLPANEVMWTVQFTDPAHGFAVTGDTNDQVQLKQTFDGGKTWSLVNPSLPAVPGGLGPTPDYSLYFVDARNGFWSNGAALYRTTDGGKTWTKIATG